MRPIDDITWMKKKRLKDENSFEFTVENMETLWSKGPREIKGSKVWGIMWCLTENEFDAFVKRAIGFAERYKEHKDMVSTDIYRKALKDWAKVKRNVGTDWDTAVQEIEVKFLAYIFDSRNVLDLSPFTEVT